MIQLPNTPFSPSQLDTPQSTNTEPWISDIINKRLTLSFTTLNYSTFITNLENYLNFIYTQALTHQDINNNNNTTLNVFQSSENYIISSSVPWNLPITSCHDKTSKNSQWSLKDEITIVLINLSLSYNARSGELINSLLNAPENSISSKESQQIWLNSFKIFKKSLEFINFIKEVTQSSDLKSNIFETSTPFINLMGCLVHSSVQLSFLSKTVWTLKNLEYDISLNSSINYSTLSRISIYIKDQLRNMLNILKSNGISTWTKYLEGLIKYTNGYLGVLLSIENYKQDKIGFSIGFVNFAIENIARKATVEENQNDNNKKKISLILKNKLKSDKLKNLTSKKIKLNRELLNDLSASSTLQTDLRNLFELVQLLDLKYNLENNNLKFDQIPESQQLLTSYLPSGRPMPIDVKPWIPDHVHAQQKFHQSSASPSGYY